MAPLGCRGLIVFVGAACLGLMVASDSKPTTTTNNLPAILTPMWSSNPSSPHMGVRTLKYSCLHFARPSRVSSSIYNRTRKSLICLGILLAVTHLPTLVIGAIWMTNLRIGPSKLYPVISGCSLESTVAEEFWRVITPSAVR